MVSPWNTGLGNSTFSKPRLPTVVPSVVSPTLSPTATPRVKRLLTSGFPNSACCAAWKSTCRGCGFMVRQEKKTLSASVTVRPGWCWNTCPSASSSNSLPAMGPPGECAPPRGGSVGRSADGGGGEPGEGGGVPRGALHARVGGHAGEAELRRAPRLHQALEARGGEGAHGGLVEHGLAGTRGEVVEDLVLAPPLGIADALGEGPHVRQEIAEVGKRRAHGEVDHAEPPRAEAGEQSLDGRHHHVLDPVEAVRAQGLLSPVLEKPAQPLAARGAPALHTHHHQRRPRGIQPPCRVELVRIVRDTAHGPDSSTERRGRGWARSALSPRVGPPPAG